MRQGRGFARIVVGTVVALGSFAATHGIGSAHDEVESSVPADRSQFDEPISEVTIEFGQAVDNVELGLIGPDDQDLPGEVVRIDQNTARLTFAPLEEEGQYIVRYLAAEDGHLLNGAISFTYGSAAAPGAGTATWVIFGVVAAVVLAIGGAWSWRLSRREPDEDDDLEPA